ncbi:flagellar basal-body rod protein FlgG [Pullulanibacillus pueri]|uniref:Flagellar hook-basal body complex protein FlhO n=1 Tax=Pullulanibacillus pueri TaxID=1437324 RepID=A0A8J3EMA5_9BACL|nr:flagellar hook-basal body protein [Pullulanibacillus pueri]MBM7681759.1 flagellar basal-body rod protein FlgG [Pullulanibacillus pueri]GGH84158.1 flagellar hook-basal body complex protein FlhO [Pullulanibacillus pueri]
MLRGYYTAASGMLAQMQRQQVLTNDIANANTPGYKADQTSLRSFKDVLISRLSGVSSSQNLGGLSTGVYLQEGIPDFSMGTLNETGKSTDLALVPTEVPADQKNGQPGALFLTVQQADGSTRYTRNGNLSVDALGRLETSDGNLILGTNNRPITVSSEDFQVASDGTVYDNGRVSGQLNIGYAANSAQMVKEGNGLYKAGEQGAVLPSAVGNQQIGYSIKQGFLEQSNVSPEEAMTDLMNTYRTFQANQQVLKAYDQSMQLVANKVGQVE